jgi:hypothetical protein
MKGRYSFKALAVRIISLALPILVASLLGYSTSAKGNEPMQVELDVFSGRPNPHWTLTSQEASEFVRLLRTLPQQKVEGSVKEGLGYRGLVVTGSEKSIAGYDEILISNGVVVARQGNESWQFTDKDRVLERWLFQTGRGELDDNLYNQIYSDIEPK